MRGKAIKVTCNCGVEFTARIADRKRGWAKSCSKSCATKRKNNKIGDYPRYIGRNPTHLINDYGQGALFNGDKNDLLY